MTESVVVTSDVEDTVRKVLPQFVQEGDEQDRMSVQLIQEQVEQSSQFQVA